MDRGDIATHWVMIDSEQICQAIIEPISLFQCHGHGEQTTDVFVRWTQTGHKDGSPGRIGFDSDITIKSNSSQGTIHLSPPHKHVTGCQNGLWRYNCLNGILAVVACLIIE
jgi:hypothetical protein